MSPERESLFAARETLRNYAKAALDWEFVEEDADIYYQRMFNLAHDVVRLTEALDAIDREITFHEAVHDSRETTSQQVVDLVVSIRDALKKQAHRA